MTYNSTRPADTDLVKKSAELIRENLESLRKDGIVFAKPPLYGAGEPKASAGDNGDRYIDTVTGNHYYKNAASQWEQTLSLDDKYKTIKDVAVLQAIISDMEENLRQVTKAFEKYTPNVIGEYKLMSHSDLSDGWVKSNGGLYSLTNYTKAFAIYGTKYGGDGINTFAVPDWRADAIRINDDGRNIDSGRVLGSEQGDAIQNITGALAGGRSIFHPLSEKSRAQITEQGALYGGYGEAWRAQDTDKGTDLLHEIFFDASRVVRTALETRMRNRSCCMYVYIGRPGIDA